MKADAIPFEPMAERDGKEAPKEETKPAETAHQEVSHSMASTEDAKPADVPKEMVNSAETAITKVPETAKPMEKE